MSYACAEHHANQPNVVPEPELQATQGHKWQLGVVDTGAIGNYVKSGCIFELNSIVLTLVNNIWILH